MTSELKKKKKEKGKNGYGSQACQETATGLHAERVKNFVVGNDRDEIDEIGSQRSTGYLGPLWYRVRGFPYWGHKHDCGVAVWSDSTCAFKGVRMLIAGLHVLNDSGCNAPRGS